MDHVASIENYANESLKKIEDVLKHEPTPVYIDLVLEPSTVHAHHRVELRVKSPHYEVISHDEGAEFYKILDHVVDTMLHELLEEKRKRIDERHNHMKAGKVLEFSDDYDDDEDEYEDDEFEDYDDEDEDEDYDIDFELDDEDED